MPKNKPRSSGRDVQAPVRETPSSATRVLRQFRVVFNAVRSHFQRVERKTGIGGAQLWAMSLLRERPQIGMNELARAMDIHQSTASNLIKGLVQRGLVEVLRKSADRRTVQLKLRPAGTTVLRSAPGPFIGVLPTALANLDDRTLKRLESDLAQLIQALGSGKRAEHTPLSQM